MSQNWAKYWRDMIIKSFMCEWQGENPDAYYYAHAESRYEESKAELAHRIPDEDMGGHEDEVFAMGVVLLSYGRLDVLPDILLYDPGYPWRQCVFRKCAWNIVPFPLTIMGNCEKSLAWYEENKHRLQWNPATEVYEIRE